MTPRRRQKTAEVELSDEQERELVEDPLIHWWGLDDSCAFDSEEKRRQAWAVHGERLTEEYIAENPGERPDAWWRYEADQHRPQPPCWKLPPGFNCVDSTPHAEAVVLHVAGELTDEEYEALSGRFSRWLNERGGLEFTDEEREALRLGDLEEGP